MEPVNSLHQPEHEIRAHGEHDAHDDRLREQSVTENQLACRADSVGQPRSKIEEVSNRPVTGQHLPGEHHVEKIIVGRRTCDHRLQHACDDGQRDPNQAVCGRLQRRHAFGAQSTCASDDTSVRHVTSQ